MKSTLKSLRKSLRGRLLLGTFVWLSVLILIAGLGFSNLFDQQAKQRLALELNVYMNQLLANFTVNDGGKIELELNLDDFRFSDPYSGIYWQIDKIDGDTVNAGVLRSRSLWDEVLNIPQDVTNTEELLEIEDQLGVDLYIQSKLIKPAEINSDYRFIIAMDQGVLEPTLNRFKLLLAIFLGLLALAVVIGILLQIILSLKPLVLLQSELKQVSRGESGKIEGDFPNEIQPLVNAFNDVLDMNAKMVEQAKTQAGNLAHALKTPLSILSNSVYEDDSDLAKLVASQVKQAQIHVNHHLARSRAIAIGHSQTVKVAVAPAVKSLVHAMQHLYNSREIVIHVGKPDDNWYFLGEATDLQEILGNVLENAYKWAESNIWLNIEMLDKNLVFTIEDDGKGLASGQLEQMFERGVRLDEKTPGTGLGLAIVQDLVMAYKGEIQAVNSTHGGLKIIITLPSIV